MLACSEGWVESCKLLLEAGADPNAQDASYAFTPLHWLSTWTVRPSKATSIALLNSEKITRLLLEFGADPSIKNCRGVTAQSEFSRFSRLKELFELEAKNEMAF